MKLKSKIQKTMREQLKAKKVYPLDGGTQENDSQTNTELQNNNSHLDGRLIIDDGVYINENARAKERLREPRFHQQEVILET